MTLRIPNKPSKKTIENWRLWRKESGTMSIHAVSLRHKNPLTGLPYTIVAVFNGIKKLNILESTGKI